MAEIGKDMALLTAGTKDKFNSMTIKNAAAGWVWSKEAFIAFVKPERYTWEFVRDNDWFTVSYFPKQMDGIHQVFARKSGRETDKVRETGLTPEFPENEITYKEACEVFVCRKRYMKQLDPVQIPEDVLQRYAKESDIIFGEPHYAVIGEIVAHIER